MKFIRLVFIFLPLFITFSCVKHNELFDLKEFQNGAIPILIRSQNDQDVLNAIDLNSTSIEFKIKLINYFPPSNDGGLTEGGSGRENKNLEFSEIKKLSLEVSYFNTQTRTSEQDVIDSYAAWPVLAQLTIDDLVDAIISIEKVEDISLGDRFTFTTGMVFEDGRNYPAFIKDSKGNWIPGYSTSYNGMENNPGIVTSLSYTVEYISNIPTIGTWTGTTHLGAFGIFSTKQNVIITALGENNYSISDVAGGFYDNFIGGNPAAVNFNDHLGSLVIYDNSDTLFNLVTDASKGFPAGTYDPVAQTITLAWYDCGNNFGDITVLTRN